MWSTLAPPFTNFKASAKTSYEPALKPNLRKKNALRRPLGLVVESKYSVIFSLSTRAFSALGNLTYNPCGRRTKLLTRVCRGRGRI